MRWELHYIRVYPTIFSCVDPRYQLSRFFTGISRRKYGELISLIGNQRVGIFPPKSEILFVLSLALIWYRNFQDRTIPLGGDTWSSFWRKELIIIRIRITRKKPYASVWEAVRNEHGSKVAGQSRDRRPTVKQRFLDVSNNLELFWRKSLNGHATVVGGHATVGRLSNNVFWTFQAIWENFEKSRGTVTRQWSEVTRPSADCQTTFFGRFKRFGKILKKVAERSRDSGWGHATVGRLSNNVFWTFQAIRKKFEKSR